MTLASPSTASPRRSRTAAVLAASLAIVLSAGLGAAPASARTPERSTAAVPLVRVQFPAHGTPGLPHVRSIRIQSTDAAGTPVSRCYSMGTNRPDADIWPCIQVDLPEGTCAETSYDGPVCDVAFPTAGGYGPFDTRQGHDWMLSYRDAPRLRA
ncbi:hypothetical protein [Clavibacter nebraskensis]|uniref:hypothetical protein n=1 Tax=Clavibacter nebraskensis TaxID=31963 RepID=UPI003F83F689